MTEARKKRVSITVNGTVHTEEIEPRLLLVHFIRDVAGLTGTHIGCETSICGACTVMVDNRAVKSCTVLAVQLDGAEVTTIEGLGQAERLHPLQEAFWNCHGLQCGYCTPGMILAAHQLLLRNPRPTEDEIRHALDGNLCRCTGYQHIVDAVQQAARSMRPKAPAARARATGVRKPKIQNRKSKI
ncbi:MAG TPA: (2Fe-2S)-binding protein [Candidatus Acidoferrales bacterium]|nr:(2Fe-2S)-binding protein [Candidatus Acidoferrales bacterium]